MVLNMIPINPAFVGAFESVAVIIVLIGLGYVMAIKGKLHEVSSGFISWTVLNLALPCYIIQNLNKSFTANDIKSLPSNLLMPVIAIILSYLAGLIIARITGVKKNRVGMLAVNTAQTNTIFMGLPVNLALFGEASIPYVLYYYMANTLFFWTVGIYLIAKDGGNKTAFSFDNLKKVLSPPLFGLFIGLIFTLIGFKLPKVANDTLSYIGGLTTPLSMLFVGYALFNTGLMKVRFEKDVIIGLICRFIVGPGINILLFSFIAMPPLMRSVFIIQSIMPVMANTAIAANEHNADTGYASVMVSLSVIISLFILPLVKVFVTG